LIFAVSHSGGKGKTGSGKDEYSEENLSHFGQFLRLGHGKCASLKYCKLRLLNSVIRNVLLLNPSFLPQT